jgi:fatty acid desaturase
MAPLTDAEKTKRAREQVQAMTAFYIHAAVFALVMLILFLIDAGNGGGWWVQWPLLGWGAGLAAHWALTFGSGLSFLTDWQERKTKELKDRM